MLPVTLPTSPQKPRNRQRNSLAPPVLESRSYGLRATPEWQVRIFKFSCKFAYSCARFCSKPPRPPYLLAIVLLSSRRFLALYSDLLCAHAWQAQS